MPRYQIMILSEISETSSTEHVKHCKQESPSKSLMNRRPVRALDGSNICLLFECLIPRKFCSTAYVFQLFDDSRFNLRQIMRLA